MSSASRQPALIAVSKAELEGSARNEVAQAISRVLAASVIANPSFPSTDTIPSKEAAAFSAQGHMPLLSYEWMLRRIWHVVCQIQGLVRARKAKISRARKWGFAIGSLMVLAGFFDPPLLAFFVPFALLTYAIAVAIGKHEPEPLHKRVAAVRISAIRDLVTGGPEPDVNDTVKAIAENPIVRGTGELGTDQIPVLTIVSDKHPFPGFGRLQGDNTFVCTPKHGETLDHKLNQVRKTVSEKITAFCESSGIANVSSGDIVVLDGRSIPIDDDLLVSGPHEDRFPRLWCDFAKRNELDSAGKSWSRIYFAVQVLFPKQKTLATFFTRPFHAGNSMGYQIAVSTMGPPYEAGGDLLESIRRYELGDSPLDFTGDPTEDSRVMRLRSLRTAVRQGPKFQREILDLEAIENLSPNLSVEEQRRFDTEAAKMRTEVMFWPIYSTQIYNFRELYSSTFTTEFFGKPEGLATVRTLYVQISRAILDGLDSLGYDISDYKDEKGGYSINVDKIDQLVMGERVYMPEKPAEQQTRAQNPS